MLRSWSLTTVRLQLQRCSVSADTVAARRWWRQSVAEAAAAAHSQCRSSSSSGIVSSNSMSLEQGKARLREAVKAALRQMTEEQMASESERLAPALPATARCCCQPTHLVRPSP